MASPLRIAWLESQACPGEVTSSLGCPCTVEARGALLDTSKLHQLHWCIHADNHDTASGQSQKTDHDEKYCELTAMAKKSQFSNVHISFVTATAVRLRCFASATKKAML